MHYHEILKQIAIKENVSIKEIETEMKKAITSAGLHCSVKEFIEATTAILKRKTIYSKFV